MGSTDIRGCFDAIDHRWMIKFIEHLIADKQHACVQPLFHVADHTVIAVRYADDFLLGF